jgi:hypothetical protein
VQILNKISFIFFSAILTSADCAKDGGGCDNCDAAIDNMYNTMQAQGCILLTAGNAVDRVLTACGGILGGIYIGYMSEYCCQATYVKPACSSHGELRLSNVTIVFEKNSSAFTNVRVDIELPFTVPVSFGVTMTQNSVDYFETLQGVTLTEGDIITFIVYNSGNLVATGQKKFTFDRPNRYCVTRKVYLVQSGNSLQFDYIAW